MTQENRKKTKSFSQSSSEWKRIREIAGSTPYTEEYLSLLVRRKKIHGKKIGKTWYVQEADLQKYIAEQKNRLEKNEFISLADAEEIASYDIAHLRALARHGILGSRKIENAWQVRLADLRHYVSLQQEKNRARRELLTSFIPSQKDRKDLRELAESFFVEYKQEEHSPSIAVPEVFGENSHKAETKNDQEKTEGENLHFIGVEHGIREKPVRNNIAEFGQFGNDNSNGRNIFPDYSYVSYPKSGEKFVFSVIAAVLILIFLFGTGASSTFLRLFAMRIPSVQNFAEKYGFLQKQGTQLPDQKVTTKEEIVRREENIVTHQKIIEQIKTHEVIDRVTNETFVAADFDTLKKEIFDSVGASQNAIKTSFDNTVSDLRSSLGSTTAKGDSSYRMITVTQRIDQLDGIEVFNGLTVKTGGIDIEKGGISVAAGNIEVNGSINGEKVVTRSVFQADGTGTSTFAGGFDVRAINIIDRATSTFGGIQLASGCLQLPTGVCASIGGSGTFNQGTANRVTFYSTSDTLDSANFLSIATSSNAFGVGTTTPSTHFSLAGDAYFDSNIITIGSSSAATTTIAFQRNATATISTSSINAFSFAATAWETPLFSLDTLNFRTGIATTAPSQTLSVQGNGLFSGTTTAGSLIATSTFFVGGTNGTNFTVLANGFSGFGTSSPGVRLGIMGIDTGSAKALVVSDSADTTRFVVENGGGVGVGTSSPVALFSVSGTGYFTGGVGIGAYRANSGLTISSLPDCIGSAALKTDATGGIICATVSGEGITTAGGWTSNTSEGVVTLATSTYRVGVGATSTPYAKLSILSDANATTTFALVPTAGQNANIFDIYNTNGTLDTVYGATGFFGLGTSSPSSKFSLSGNTYFDSNLITISSSTAANLQIDIQRAATTTIAGVINAYSFATSMTAAPIFSIDGVNSRIGIGTTSPGSLLSVQGAANFSSTATSTLYTAFQLPNFFATSTNATSTISGSLFVGTSTPTGTNALFTVGTSTAIFYVDRNSGNVGIGSTSPNAKFALAGDGTGSGRVFVVTDKNNTERITILNNGNVGIGTTTPITQLTVTSGATTPAKVAQITLNANGQDIYVQGRYAYTVNSGSGANSFEIWAISDSASTTLISQTNLTLSGVSIYVQGDYAYILNNTSINGFEIWDISNPYAPKSMSRSTRNGASGKVYVQGRYAYMIANASTNAFEIWDVSNPASPARVSQSTLGSFGQRGLSVRGSYAYIPTSAGLEIWDVSDPASPTRVSSGALGNTGGGVYVQGRYAYVVTQTTATNAFEIWDVSNPASPARVSQSTLKQTGREIYVQGRYAYLADTNSTNAFEIWDVSNPVFPTRVSQNTLSGGATSIKIQGRYAYIMTTNPGILEIWDIGGAYIQQFEAGGIEAGTLAIHNNLTALDGSFEGGLTVGRSLNVTGSGSFIAATSTLNTTTNIFTISTASSTNSIFSVLGNGNVGIGTTTPAQLLSVQGNALISGTTTAGSLIATSTLYVGSTTGARFYIAENGNVGIGTAGPGIKLDIVGDGVRIDRTSGDPFIIFNKDGSATGGSRISGVNNGIAFTQSNGTNEKMRIDTNTGNVGIGTTTPAQLLSVQGNALISGTSTVGSLIATSTLYVGSTTGARFYIAENGNVGIGTAAPVKKLQINDASVGALTYPLKIVNSGADTNGTAVGMLFTVDSDSAGSPRGKGALVYEQTTSWNRGSFHFLQNTNGDATNAALSNAVMTIQNSGNVGIGTTSPAGQLAIQENDIAPALYVAGGNSGAELAIFERNVGSSEKFSIFAGNGDVWTQYDVLPGSGTVWNVGVDDTNDRFTIYTGASVPATTDQFSIDTSGNVGIGTTGPDGKLHIHSATAGTVTASVNGDELVLENSGTTGMSFLSPNTATQFILFGDADDNDIGDIRYNHTDNSLRLTTNAGAGFLHLTSAGNVGIGTTSPATTFNIYNGNESTTLTNFTQAIASAGLLITTDYTVGAYTPGLFWATQNNNGTKPKAGIWLLEDNSGTDMYFGTSNNYATGITNNGLILDQAGNVGIGESLEVGTGITAIATKAAGDILAGDSATTFQFDSSANTQYVQQSSANTTGFWISGRKSRGTAAVPSVITTGDDLLLLRAYGHDGTNFVESSRITFDTQGTIGTGAVPGIINFLTADSAGTLSTKMSFDSNGTLTLDQNTNNIGINLDKDVTNENNTVSTLAISDASVVSDGGTYTKSGQTLLITNNVSETSGSITDTKVALYIQQLHPDATGDVVFINNDATGAIALDIDAENTTADAVNVVTEATSGIGLDVLASALTTGSIARFYSNGADTSARSLVNIINDNTLATGAVALRVQQDSTADIVNIFDGATEVFTILDGGNVGIRAASPAVDLHIVGNAENSLQNVLGVFNPLESPLSAKNNGAAIIIGNSSSSYYNKIATVFEQNNPSFLNPALAFYTMNQSSAADSEVERMRISSAGNVGIGTTSPSSLLTLEANNVASVLTLSNNDSNDVIAAGTDIGRILFQGDDAGTFATFAEILAEVDLTTGADSPGRLSFWTTPNGSNTQLERMRIDNAGNVGIGTTNPGATLDVKGSVTLRNVTSGAGTAYICTTLATGVISSSTSACTTSSLKYKENIEPLSYGLDDVLKMKPLFYDYKPELLIEGRQVGFIAEDMFNVIPEVVGLKDGKPDNIEYSKLTSVLVKAVQELDGKVSANAEFLPTEAEVGAADIVAMGSSTVTYDEKKLTIGTTTVSLLKRAKAGDAAIGIVSAEKFQKFAGDIKQYAENPQPVALSGRVAVKVSTENGSINPGDRVALSSLAGVGMKDNSLGTTVGIALQVFDGANATTTETVKETLPDGSVALTQVKIGKILVFVSLGYSAIDSAVASSAGAASAAWSVDQVSGKVNVGFYGDIDMHGNNILNVASIVSENGKWKIGADGVLVVEEVQAKRVKAEESLEVGTSAKPTGITIYDSVSGQPYCLKMVAGVLQSAAGGCGALGPEVGLPAGSPTSSGSTVGDSSSAVQSDNYESSPSTSSGTTIDTASSTPVVTESSSPQSSTESATESPPASAPPSAEEPTPVSAEEPVSDPAEETVSSSDAENSTGG